MEAQKSDKHASLIRSVLLTPDVDILRKSHRCRRVARDYTLDTDEAVLKLR